MSTHVCTHDKSIDERTNWRWERARQRTPPHKKQGLTENRSHSYSLLVHLGVAARATRQKARERQQRVSPARRGDNHCRQKRQHRRRRRFRHRRPSGEHGKTRTNTHNTRNSDERHNQGGGGVGGVLMCRKRRRGLLRINKLCTGGHRPMPNERPINT